MGYPLGTFVICEVVNYWATCADSPHSLPYRNYRPANGPKSARFREYRRGYYCFALRFFTARSAEHVRLFIVAVVLKDLRTLSPEGDAVLQYEGVQLADAIHGLRGRVRAVRPRTRSCSLGLGSYSMVLSVRT